MPFENNNVSAGLPKDAAFIVGESNVDSFVPIVERDVGLPWASDSAASYFYYDCTIEIMLDSGIVVHNRLPQINNTADSLGSVYIDDPNISSVNNRGVNLKSNDQYQDIVQRMGHSRYWFRLSGEALRVGYKVPIPAIKTIGGVVAIPYDKNPQWAFNRIFPGGNYGGVILWHARWSLWYTVASPPRDNTIPAVNLEAHIDGTTAIPDLIQAPFSFPDGNAVANGFNPGGKPGLR